MEVPEVSEQPNISMMTDAVNFIGWRLFSSTLSGHNQDLMETTLKHLNLQKLLPILI